MTRRILISIVCMTLAAAVPLGAADATAEWTAVAPGVDYREFTTEHTDIHVTRIDLTNELIQVVATPEPYRGTTVSDFAVKTKALSAINGDYFDPQFKPRGLMISPCDHWAGAKDNKMHQAVVAVASGRGTIQYQEAFTDTENVTAAVAGWPVLIRECTPLTAKELPGSDIFTRSPQPRTAAGLSEDGTKLYFVVADGRRTGIPGLTLAELGTFMAGKLEACSAVNLDGGGSSAMWVADRIVNRPADGLERRVGDHLAVVLRSDWSCPQPEAMQTASTTTTTKVTTTTITTTTTIVPSTTTTPTTAPASASTTTPTTGAPAPVPPVIPTSTAPPPPPKR